MKTAKSKIQSIDNTTEVSPQEKAFLVHGAKRVAILAEVASKYSLFFRYLENHELVPPAQPVNLLIRNNGQSTVR